MDIFKLVGSVFVDTDKANESLAKVDKKAEGTGGKLSKLAAGAGKMALGIGAAAAAVGGAMIASAKSTAENADVVDKASQRMKIGAESYQELAHAAGLSGVQMSTMEAAAKKLEGTDLNLDDALAQIYELGTAEERGAKAAELFGDKVAYDMTPMLNASAEEMAAMRQEAHDLGIVMDEDAVKAGASMNDMFSKVQESFSSVANQIGVEVMPIIAELLQWVLDHMPEIQAVVKTVTSTIGSVIKALMPVIKDILTVATPVISNLIQGFTGLTKIVSSVFSGMSGTIKSSLNTISRLVNTVIRGLNRLKIPDWVPGIGGQGIHLTELPMLAKGGIVEDGKAIVGEAGPELLTVSNGRAKVQPLAGGDKVAKAAETTNNITLNVYATEKQDVRELAAVIMDEIQNAVNRRGAVFA